MTDRRTARRRKLDEAIREYMADFTDERGIDGVVVGWILGVAHARYPEGGVEEDNLLIESTEGINNFLARGLADSTAESFASQAMGYSDTEDQEE